MDKQIECMEVEEEEVTAAKILHIPDKEYCLMELHSIINRNKDSFAQLVLTYAVVLEKTKI